MPRMNARHHTSKYDANESLGMLEGGTTDLGLIQSKKTRPGKT